uniref:Uncharacterized protein n=1 Tax=Anguilla anguilla TaxID=7936 RepID=A0A0E9WL57_ANGAN
MMFSERDSLVSSATLRILTNEEGDTVEPSRVKDRSSRVMDRFSRVMDMSSRVKDSSSRVKDLAFIGDS